MKNLIFISLQSVKHKLNPYHRKYTFEIFGYDFILDHILKLWLIEVNTNPCLEESSPLLEMLIPRMVDDAFKLTLDKLCPPKNESLEGIINGESADCQNGQFFHVNKYNDNENLWFKIFFI